MFTGSDTNEESESVTDDEPRDDNVAVGKSDAHNYIVDTYKKLSEIDFLSKPTERLLIFESDSDEENAPRRMSTDLTNYISQVQNNHVTSDLEQDDDDADDLADEDDITIMNIQKSLQHSIEKLVTQNKETVQRATRELFTSLSALRINIM